MLNYKLVDWHMPVFNNRFIAMANVSIALSSNKSIVLPPPSPILNPLALTPHYFLFFCCQFA